MTPTERLAYLKSLEVLTSQEVFDLTVIALRLQGCKSAVWGISGDSCKYRGPNGLACAAGHHIKNGEYSRDMEGSRIHSVLLRKPLLHNRLGPHLSLLSHLQSIHDGYPVEQWEHKWSELANREGLDYTHPAEK